MLRRLLIFLHSREADLDNAGYDDPNGVASDVEVANPKGGRKPPKLGMQKRQPTSTDVAAVNEEPGATAAPSRGGKMVPVHQSRIQDRPPKQNEKDSSLKIKIELDLEVEVELYARVKGDIK